MCGGIAPKAGTTSIATAVQTTVLLVEDTKATCSLKSREIRKLCDGCVGIGNIDPRLGFAIDSNRDVIEKRRKSVREAGITSQV